MSSPLLQRGDEVQGMPVRRRGDDHRVEPLEVQQFLVKLECLRPLALQLLQFVGVLLEVIAVHVADGRDLDAAGLQGRPGVDHPIPTDADDAEPQRAVFGRAEDRSANAAEVAAATVPPKNCRRESCAWDSPW